MTPSWTKNRKTQQQGQPQPAGVGLVKHQIDNHIEATRSAGQPIGGKYFFYRQKLLKVYILHFVCIET